MALDKKYKSIVTAEVISAFITCKVGMHDGNIAALLFKVRVGIEL